MKRISSLCCLLLCSLMALADLPFRQHRYDAFKVLPVKENSIVFVGNSITNMHEWWEAFGCRHNIINRGVSGAISDEILANIESIAAGKPAKTFIMLGTNDLGTAGINTPEHVLANATLIIDRLQKESPKTQIYIQSILPSNTGLRTVAQERATNQKLKELCQQKNVTYIDLFDDLLSITQNYTHTLDGLHLKASGYEIWCKKIQQYVGTNSIYPANTSTLQLDGHAPGSWGMRNTYFSMYPVADKDILIIGDEMIHGGEWHELLQSPRIKNRGTGWGYGGPNLTHTLNAIPVILHNGKQCPAKICLYAGVSDVNSNADVNAACNNYKKIIEKIRSLAPQTQLFLMGLQPTSNTAINQRIVTFNEQLKNWAKNDSKIDYIDLYTDFAENGVASSKYFNGNYLYGMGYVKVANCIAQALKEKDVIAISMEEAQKNYAYHEVRTQLGNAMVQTAYLQEGDGVGAYTSQHLSSLKAKVSKAADLLEKGGTTAQFEAMAKELQEELKATLPNINLPAFSTAGHETWYKLHTPLREDKYTTAYGAGNALIGENLHNYATGMWKFTQREDGKLNIINRADHTYISPEASYSTAITTTSDMPATGWELSYSNTPGKFIIHAGKVQLNQTGSAQNYQIYNWSGGESGVDREDTGCQFAIAPAGTPDTIVKEDNQIVAVNQLKNGWYQVKVISGTHADMNNAIKNGKNYLQTVTEEYRQNATNYYPLKYAALQTAAPAATYVYLTRDAKGFYFTALNGHHVLENATACRNLPDDRTNIAGNNGEFVIAHWTAFNAQDGKEWPYVGKFSTQTSTYKIYSVADKALSQYEVYQVNISGTDAAAEIGQDAWLECNNAQLMSVKKVYHGGWFFVRKGTSLTPADFTAAAVNGMKATISINQHKINVSYAMGNYAELGKAIGKAQKALQSTTEGNHPGCFSTQARTDLKTAILRAEKFNETTGKPAEEIRKEIQLLDNALLLYYQARNDIRFSTPGNETWYYITSASTQNYCKGLAIQPRSTGENMTFVPKKLSAEQIWCLVKNEQGKVAIRNYAGNYMNNVTIDQQPHPIYTVAPWKGSSVGNSAYTIVPEGKKPIHAQQDGAHIVNWEAADNNASLWNFTTLTPEELNSELSIKGSTVQQVQVNTGIGNTAATLLHATFQLEGLKGDLLLEGVKGELNNRGDVVKVKLYKTRQPFEYRQDMKEAELLGEATPAEDGSFLISFAQPTALTADGNMHYWLAADISKQAAEGSTIDPAITAYIINGKEMAEQNGNPEFHTNILPVASTVEYLNTYGSRYYRIPAITTAQNGWLVTVADKRYASYTDLPNNIDVVASVSKDNGRTWTEPVIIAGTPQLGGDYGHGDPAIVTDKETGDIIVLVTAKVGFFYGVPDNCPRIKKIVSHDNGMTWEAPVDITDQLYGAGCPDATRRKFHSLFVSSGAFLQTRSGRLMAVAPVRETASKNHADFGAHVIYSDDHGKTWTMTNKAALKDADESKIVELDNGSLMIKSRKGGHPYYVISHDGGTTWSAPAQWNEMNDPNCNGDLIRYTSLSQGNDKNRLLASIPHASGRSNVSVFLSYDEGSSWPIHKSICPKGSAYSSLTILPDSTIGCFYEEDGIEGGYQMRFVRFSLEWLSNGKDQILDKEAAQQQLIDNAREILGKCGVGYPQPQAKSRDSFNEAISAFEKSQGNPEDVNRMNEAIRTYKGSTIDIQMPESGKAYLFTNVAKDGTCQYMCYKREGMEWVADAAQATPFVCKENKGQWSFVNNDGKFLEWFGINNTHHDNKGYSDAYAEKWNNFSIAKLIGGNQVQVGDNAQLFGYVAIEGKRIMNNAEAKAFFVVGKNNEASGATAPFFNDTYSSAILMTETEYPNKVVPRPSEGLEGAACIASFSAPFATLVPASAQAYCATEWDESKNTVCMKQLNEGEAIPPHTGIILTAMDTIPLTMIPQTDEPVATCDGNLLLPSAGTAKVLTEQDYILSTGIAGTAFYQAANGVSFPINQAFLHIEKSGTAIVGINWGGNISGIGNTEAGGLEAVIYDLSGRRIQGVPRKGVYIKNRKKCFAQ